MADAPSLTLPTEQDETAQAQALARRYRSEFVDLRNFRIQHEVLRSVPLFTDLDEPRSTSVLV